MENPFRYGQVVTGEYFTDREEELAELTLDVRSGQNVVLISPRRYGKTSLVKMAMERLREDRVLVAYLDLYPISSRARFVVELTDAIYRGLLAPLDQVRRRAIDWLQGLSLRPKITLNQDGTPSFEIAPGTSEADLDGILKGVLELPAQIAAQRERRVALVLDEFQEVVSIDPNLPALMRTGFQHQAEVAPVFLGRGRHLMRRLFTDRNQPMYRMAKPFNLKKIAAADLDKFIRHRFASTNLSLDEGVPGRVLAITDCHPYDTQELCFFLWNLAQTNGHTVTPGMVDKAVERVLEAEDARYTTLWDTLSAHRRQVLTALVLYPEGPIFAEAYRFRHELGPAPTVQRALRELVERDVVEHSPREGYSVPDPFLRTWVARLNGVEIDPAAGGTCSDTG